MSKKNKKQLITRKNYQEYLQKEAKETGDQEQKKKFLNGVKKEKKPKLKAANSRLDEKGKGRRLDHFYNWSIIVVLVAIVLVFVLAFVI